MAETLKNKNARAAKIAGYASETQANILAYLDALTEDMATGNVAGVIAKCNSRTRALDVQDLIGRRLKYGEGAELLANPHNMDAPRIVSRANAVAELLQNLRQTTRTNCRYSTFTGPMAQAAAVRVEILAFAETTGKNTRVEKKLG